MWALEVFSVYNACNFKFGLSGFRSMQKQKSINVEVFRCRALSVSIGHNGHIRHIHNVRMVIFFAGPIGTQDFNFHMKTPKRQICFPL